jgi:putative oxidoreductase
MPERGSRGSPIDGIRLHMFKRLLTPAWNGRSIIFVRIAVGLIFFTQGILKYVDPHMGVLRFMRIGFPIPDFSAHFVGAFEIICGLLVLVGLFTRLASIPLLAVILTAIATTKIPELFRAGQGFWFMVSDARTDFAMTMSLIFLLIAGGGGLSLDLWLVTRDEQGSRHSPKRPFDFSDDE